MAAGYNPIIDTAVVVACIGLTINLLGSRPQRLLLYLPTMLSLYFIVPVVTLLTNWHTIPILLLFWWILNRGGEIPSPSRPVMLILILIFSGQVVVAMIHGDTGTRVILRASYYLGLATLFVFTYFMVQRPGGKDLLVRGLAIAAAIHVCYSLYQIVAYQTGLPFRAIVRATSPVGSVAYEGGGLILRVNGLANEPKRLGYVLLIGALAFFELRHSCPPAQARRMFQWGIATLVVSILTFSGSYFLALFALGIIVSLWNRKFLRYAFRGLAALALLAPIFSSTTANIWSALQVGYERRAAEVEVGLDGDVVYRQEFYAQDFLETHPSAILTGVGIGRYNRVLFQEYGHGVGYGGRGNRILPINSNLYELIFDLGGIATALIYISLAVLALRAKKQGERLFAYGLFFLLAQSLTIQVLHFIAILAGSAVAQLSRKQQDTSDLLTKPNQSRELPT